MRSQKITSLIANQSVDKESDSKKILSVLNENIGLTYQEISTILNWRNPNKVSRRMKELVSSGKALELKPRICSIGKSLCTAYIKATS